MSATPSHHAEPAFTIAIDPARRFVELTLRGLWTVETCRRFEGVLRPMLRLLPAGGCPLGTQVTLFDLLAFPVQPQDTLLYLASLAADRSIGSSRTAIVTTSALVRRQAIRAAPDYGIYRDRDAAMAWLLDEGRQRAA